jgi:hypothetical protein
MMTARAGCATAVVASNLYAIGGTDRVPVVNFHDSVERFDPATNVWSHMSLMALKPAFPRAAALNGKMYVQGGRGPGQTVSHRVLEVFDPAAEDPLGSWSTTPLSESGPKRKSGAMVAWPNADE